VAKDTQIRGGVFGGAGGHGTSWYVLGR